MHAEKQRRGLAVVRMLVGAIFITHGWPKLAAALADPRVPQFAAQLHRMGFVPGVGWAWAVTLVEFLGGVCLLLGVLVPVAAALIGIEMVVAGVTVNLARGYYWTRGGWEMPLILAVLCGVLALTSPGRTPAARAERR